MGTTQINSSDITDRSISASDLFTGSNSSILMMTGSAPTWTRMGDWMSSVASICEDWLGGTVTGTNGWYITGSGAGATITFNATANDNNHPGVISLSTGTTATGRTAIINNSGSISFGSGAAICELMIQLPVLSTATERYNIFCGFGDVPASGSMIDGLLFRYGDELNSGQWQMMLSNNGVNTIVNSSMAVAANTWTKLRIDVDANGTTGSFYVGETLIGNISGSLPLTSARATGLILKIQKTIGTTARTLLSDYVMFTKAVTR